MIGTLTLETEIFTETSIILTVLKFYNFTIVNICKSFYQKKHIYPTNARQVQRLGIDKAKTPVPFRNSIVALKSKIAVAVCINRFCNKLSFCTF